jgi:hypothetical protein
MDEHELQKAFDEATAHLTACANPWVSIHVLFEQMTAAGFTDKQATAIIGVWMSRATEK